MKSKIFIKGSTPISRFGKVCVALCIAATLGSCEKSNDDPGFIENIRVSADESPENVLASWELDVAGGEDTLYVFSTSPIQASFETAEIDSWVKIQKIESVSGTNMHRLIVEVKPMTEEFKMRSGVLNMGNETPLAGLFLSVSQGYMTRIAEDFVWLLYGTGNPMDDAGDKLINQWTTNQKQYGWKSQPIGVDESATFGKNGYVQLGSELVGGNLLSPIIPGIEMDSVLLLTFNAVAYTTRAGDKDGNQLTLKISGLEFETGGQEQVLTLPYYDYQSALIMTNLWKDTHYAFLIKKSAINPTASTMQLQFFNGNPAESAKNRVLLDNVKLYTVAQYEEVVN